MSTMALAPPAGDALTVLAHARDRIAPELRAVVDELPAEIRMIAGYHYGWWDADGRPAAGVSGKALRPALAMLCAQAVGAGEEAGVRAAVAVELVHNFSLVHDDIIDNDVTRRHRPTAWAVFGMPAALLAGNAMLTLAYQILARDGGGSSGRPLDVLGTAVQEMIAGQHADIAFEARARVTVGEYLAMAAGKTAALTAASCELGALAGGAASERAEQFRRFGHHLGLGFQIADDLLGIWGDPRATGKPVRSDLRSRKKSLPVVHALASGTPAGRRLATLYDRENPLSEEEVQAAADLIEQAGSRRFATGEASRQLAAATAALEGAHPERDAHSALLALAHLAIRRQS